jgi:hypothetical protein
MVSNVLFCLAALALTQTALAATRILADWHFIGPWPVGKTEFDADPLAAYDAPCILERRACSPHPLAWSGPRLPPASPAELQLPSELAEGGFVGWSALTADRNGALRIAFPTKGA